MLRIFFLFVFLGVSGSSFSEIYKWVDENGKVHFGDRKIEGVNQEKIKISNANIDWSRFQIDIKTIDASLTEEEQQDIESSVNHVYEFFDRILHFDIYKTVPVNILILADRSAYVQHLTKTGFISAIASYGVYLPDENQIITYIREDRGSTFRTIKHEVSHAIVDTIMPYAPAWLNEGLAEQMETLDRSDSGLFLQPHPGNRDTVFQANKNGNLRSITEFLKLPSTEWRHTLSRGKSSFQGQAGQFVYFLLSTPPNRNFVVRLMHKFSRGDRTLAYYLVDENYIGGLKAMEVTWQRWLENQTAEDIKFY